MSEDRDSLKNIGRPAKATMATQEADRPSTSQSSPRRPREAQLALEDDEKRVLRERVEVLEAQDVDRLEADLRNLSNMFNQRLQAITTENATAEPSNNRRQARETDCNSPFVDNGGPTNSGTSRPVPSATVAPTTPVRRAFPPIPPQQQHVLFALQAPQAPRPAPPTFPPVPEPSQLRPYLQHPAVAAAQWQHQGPQNPTQFPQHGNHQGPTGGGTRFNGQNGGRGGLQLHPPSFPIAGMHRQGGGGFLPAPIDHFHFRNAAHPSTTTNHPAPPPFNPAHNALAAAPLLPPLRPAVPQLPPHQPAHNPPYPAQLHPNQPGPMGRGLVPGPVSAPVVLGPLPGRPAVLVWHPPAPRRGGVWAAMAREPERIRRRFIPRPVGSSMEGTRARGSPVSRVRG